MLTKSWPLTSAVIAWHEADMWSRKAGFGWHIERVSAEVVQGRLMEAIERRAWPGSASFWYQPAVKL